MRILNRIKVCSKVGMHAWYDTDLGFAIRKPIGSVRPTSDDMPLYSGIAYQPSIIHPGGMTWWQRFWAFIKRILHI